MKTFWTDVNVDANPMPLYVAQPTDNPRGAVVVLQEVFGVNSHIRDVTERVGRLGFLAVAPDLFYRQGPRFECGYDEFQEKALPRARAMKNDEFLKDIDQVFAYLKNEFGLESIAAGVMGFCLGGRLTYITATQREIGAAVSFYGSGVASGPIKDTKDIACPIVLFYGGQDENIPASDVEKVRLALHENSIEAEVITYESADHGFFCNERKSFEPTAAADAWQRTQKFLKKYIES